MSRYSDLRSLGHSKIAPFVPGESPSNRHARRLAANLAARACLDAWLEANGLQLVTTNEGHHWRILRPDGSLLAQWWPSSAKLVFGAEFRKGLHCHDFEQLRDALTRRLRRDAEILR